jgi:predicted ATPase with chaperone activity
VTSANDRHRGVLLLDELTEFRHDAIEAISEYGQFSAG